MIQEERFWQKVRRGEPDECWPWTGASDPRSGYGLCTGPTGKNTTAHRMAYQFGTGDWLPNRGEPGHKDVDHTCRNRACCNPTHLRALTHREHMALARKEFCVRGHPLRPDTVYIGRRSKRRPDGVRLCKACHAAKMKKYRARKRAGLV